MSQSFTVLTVCTGNLHRSALAAELLDTWAGWYLPSDLRAAVIVGSAGTHAPAGEPMGPRTRRFASSLGAAERGHRARLLTDPLVAEADLILAASRAHRDEIVRRVPRAMRRTFTIREAGRLATLIGAGPPASVADLIGVVASWAEHRADVAAATLEDDDIIDPQGKDASATEEMVRQEVPALVALATTLWGMPRGDAEAYVRAAADPASLS